MIAFSVIALDAMVYLFRREQGATTGICLEAPFRHVWKHKILMAILSPVETDIRTLAASEAFNLKVSFDLCSLKAMSAADAETCLQLKRDFENEAAMNTAKKRPAAAATNQRPAKAQRSVAQPVPILPIGTPVNGAAKGKTVFKGNVTGMRPRS